LACCAFKRRVGLNCPNLVTSESAICAHFDKQAETAPSIAFGSRGALGMEYRDTYNAFGVRSCLGSAAAFAATARFATAETGRRDIVRSASIVNQVR
jgi:hypothetical protein